LFQHWTSNPFTRVALSLAISLQYMTEVCTRLDALRTYCWLMVRDIVCQSFHQRN